MDAITTPIAPTDTQSRSQQSATGAANSVIGPSDIRTRAQFASRRVTGSIPVGSTALVCAQNVSGNRGRSRWALVASRSRRAVSILDILSIWILRISQWITRSLWSVPASRA
jgi:hypothetical protein